jgi:hypothetical protein
VRSIVLKTISEQECAIFTTLYLVVAKNTDSWHTRKGDLQHAFPLVVLMVQSSMLTVATYDERPSSDVFSLSETICFGSLKFITDRFGSLSPSPMGDGSVAAIMGSTCSGPSSPPWAMMGDSTELFPTMSDEEGRVDLPSPKRHGTGAWTAPATTISRSEIALTTQAMATIPPQLDINHPLEQRHSHQEGLREQVHTQSPYAE